jgi:alpha-ketoglutarate-dependent taurine dioxygenase
MLIVLWQEEGLKRTSSVVRLEDGSKIPAEVVREIEAVSEACTVELPWWDGDLIMIDNTRVLHGRRAFNDQKRAILIRMCRSVSW